MCVDAVFEELWSLVLIPNHLKAQMYPEVVHEEFYTP